MVNEELLQVFREIEKENQAYKSKLIILSNEKFFGYIKYRDTIIPSMGRLSIFPENYKNAYLLCRHNKNKPKYLRIYQINSMIVVSGQQQIDINQPYKDIAIKYLKACHKDQGKLLTQGNVYHIQVFKAVIKNQDFYYPRTYPQYSVFFIKDNYTFTDKKTKVNEINIPGLYIIDDERLFFLREEKQKKTKRTMIMTRR